MSKRRPSTFLAIAASAALAGCTAWKPISTGPRGYLEAKHPTQIRVTRMDAPPLVLRYPTIRNDSIVGLTEDLIETGVEVNRGTVEIRRFSLRRTLILGIAVSPVGWLVAFTLFYGGF